MNILDTLKLFGTEEVIGVLFLIILAVVLYVTRQFIKDSIRELKHVVWPTREETKKYFITVTVVLILFGVYLFIVSSLFTKGLFGLKELVNGTNSVEEKSNTVKTKMIDIKKISPEVKPTIKLDNKKVETKTNEVVKDIIGTGTTK